MIVIPLATALAGCATPGAEWGWPEGIPAPVVPVDNPMSSEKVELGRRLFADVRLSGEGRTSCATCHDPEAAFADGRAVPLGEDGDPLPHNAPGLAGVAWYGSYGWANPVLTTLEQQAVVPLVADAPPELGLAPVVDRQLVAIAADPQDAPLIEAAFPDGFGLPEVVRALAAYERTLSAFDTPYDRGELDPDQQRGEALFADLGCDACHSGPTFTAAFRAAGEQSDPDGAFASTGGADPALSLFTGDSADLGRFRIPSLRDVAATGPWLHDGSAPTLEAAIARYSGLGGTPGVDPRLERFDLDDAQIADLTRFLDSLTSR